MRRVVEFSLALVLCGAAQAADPPDPKTRAVAQKPLDLRVGDVRKYMMPNEFQAAVNAPDADKYAIVVEGNRPPPELKSLRAVPMGLGALFWSFRHPSGAWRIFVPDVNAPPSGPVLDKVPPPVFRRGP